MNSFPTPCTQLDSVNTAYTGVCEKLKTIQTNEMVGSNPLPDAQEAGVDSLCGLLAELLEQRASLPHGVLSELGGRKGYRYLLAVVSYLENQARS